MVALVLVPTAWRRLSKRRPVRPSQAHAAAAAEGRAIFFEHDPGKPVLGLDPRMAAGFRITSCSDKTWECCADAGQDRDRRTFRYSGYDQQFGALPIAILVRPARQAP